MIERRTYEPYGRQQGPVEGGPGFTGHVQDDGTGLIYMQQRYQDPETGRFLSIDPVSSESGNAQHFNRYAYAYNNPYKFSDPDGRCPMCLGAVIGGGIEIGMQLAVNGKVDNWTAVGVSAAVGAVTGGVGSIMAKAAMSGAVTTTAAVTSTAVVGGAASGVGKVAEAQLTGQPVSSKEVAVAVAAGAAGSGAGAKIGLQSAAKLESMAASNGLAGHVGRTTQAAVQQGGKITEAATSASQKGAQITVDSASSYAEKRINK